MSSRLPVSVRVKLVHPDARLPTYGSEGASGADLYAVADTWLYPGVPTKVATGIAAEIPAGLELQVRPRSSASLKGIHVAMGTIDADYRGEISVIATNVSSDPILVPAGSRIAQLVLAPVLRAAFEPAEELGDTARGDGAFGSTGQ